VFLQQTRDSWDSQKTLTAGTVAALAQSCSSIDHFYDIALSEYNQQKNLFWTALLKVHKIDPERAVSKTVIQSVLSVVHPTWTIGQVRCEGHAFCLSTTVKARRLGGRLFC